MSKGGAGKVYFVLYLAVVLELLIIIVERDEAEEHLHSKQKETMKIVQSILSQLSSGSGSEGMNTRPQDEITIPPPGVNIKEVLGADIKSTRKYLIEVGVTNVAAYAKQKEGEEKKEYLDRLNNYVTLANVAELEYAVFYSSDPNPEIVPDFPNSEELSNSKVAGMQIGESVTAKSGSSWSLKSYRKIEIDSKTTFDKVDKEKPALDPMHPVYDNSKLVFKGESFAPPGINADSIFAYSIYETEKSSGWYKGSVKGIDKRAFVVNFNPTSQAGWYKLRFFSRTNKILGVRKDENDPNGNNEVSDDISVNIGTVTLKVKDLRIVQKQLASELEAFSLPTEKDLQKSPSDFQKGLDAATEKALKENTEKTSEIVSRIKLYGYIVKLVTPGQSATFDQNKSAIEFNVRVITPKPEGLNPDVKIAEDFQRFDALEASFPVTMTNYKQGQSTLSGTVHRESDGPNSEPVAKINFTQVNKDENATTAGNREFIATVDKKLSAGSGASPRRYIVKIAHSAQSKKNEKTSMLTVYPALVEANINTLKQKFSGLAVYGKRFFFNFEPPSGNKIQPEQFCYYFKTDADPQERGCVAGIGATVNENLFFGANAKKASLRIVWNDPITKQQVDVFPMQEVTIKQSSPNLTITNQSVNVQGDDRLRVTISGLKVAAPEIGSSDPSKVANLNVEAGDVKVSIKGYRLAGKVTPVLKGSDLTLQMELIGEPDEDGNIKGKVELKIKATATNPLNGATSEQVQKTINFSVNKKVDN